MTAERFNQGKSPLSFILDAPRAIACQSQVLEFGAQKYSRSNWKNGLPKDEIIDSLLRHLTAYHNGELIDPESGLPHVGHIMCNATFLAELELRGDYDPPDPVTITVTINDNLIFDTDILEEVIKNVQDRTL